MSVNGCDYINFNGVANPPDTGTWTSFSAPGPAPTVTAAPTNPTILSAYINSNLFYINWQVGNLPLSGTTGLSLSASGGGVTLSGVNTNNNITVATLSRSVSSSETVSLSYTPGDFIDASSLSLSSFSSFTVNFTTKPPPSYNLNTSDALAPNLALAYLFNQASGTTDKDYSQYANYSIFNTANGGTITRNSDNVEGPYISIATSGAVGNSNGVWTSIGHTGFNNVETYTFAIRFSTTASGGGGYAPIIAKWSGGPLNIWFGMDFGLLGLGNGYVQVEISDGTTSIHLNGTAALNDGAWHTAIITRNAGVALKLYIDGVYINFVADTLSTGSTLNTGVVSLGELAQSPGRAWNGNISWFLGWDAVLTDGNVSTGTTAGGQIADLYNNPMRMFTSNGNVQVVKGDVIIPNYSGAKIVKIYETGEIISYIYLPSGATPYNMIVVPNSNYVYCSDEAHSQIYKIDLTSNLYTTIKGFSNSHTDLMGISPDQTKIFVSSGDVLNMVDISTDTVYTTHGGNSITGYQMNQTIAFNSSGTQFYISNNQYNYVNVYNYSDWSTVTTISIGYQSPCQLGNALLDNNGYYYLGNQNNLGNIYVINTNNNTLQATITSTGQTITPLLSKDKTVVYCADDASNNLNIIDTASLTLSSSINLGFHTYAAAQSNNGRYLYLGNSSTWNLEILDLTNGSIINVVPIGTYVISAPLFQSLSVSNNNYINTGFDNYFHNNLSGGFNS